MAGSLTEKLCSKIGLVTVKSGASTMKLLSLYDPPATLITPVPSAATLTKPTVPPDKTSPPLKLLAPLLSGHVAPGGWLVMAGILARQADEITQAYAPAMDVRVADQEDGWVLMCARRAAPQR